MGNCFSDPSSDAKHKGQRLGSGPATPQNANTPQPAQSGRTTTSSNATRDPGRMVGDGFEDANRTSDPREMARIAAEERMKKNERRGISSSNPKSGQLSAKLEAERKKPLTSSNPNEDRPMDARNWN